MLGLDNASSLPICGKVPTSSTTSLEETEASEEAGIGH